MSLEIVSLHNHGNAEKEYVLLRTTDKVNLHDYILFDNSYAEDHKPSNIHRHMYWFPKRIIDSGWNIYLYSREGTNTISLQRKVYNCFWNSNAAIWNDEKDTAHLLEVLLIDRKTTG